MHASTSPCEHAPQRQPALARSARRGHGPRGRRHRGRARSRARGRSAVPPIVELRPPEIGLVMLRGRIGGDGAPFNLGEATVTRAAVRLETGEVGIAYVLGRDAAKARLAAVLDAPAQRGDARPRSRPPSARPSRARLAAERRARRRPDRRDARRFLHPRARGGLTMYAQPCKPGFADARSTTSQAVFRSVMMAMARPGTVRAHRRPCRCARRRSMPAAAAHRAGAVRLRDARLARPDARGRRRGRRVPALPHRRARHGRSQARRTSPSCRAARDLPAVRRPSRTARSTIPTARPRWSSRSSSFDEATGWRLTGPGIAGEAPLPRRSAARRHAATGSPQTTRSFPRGVDLVFVVRRPPRGAAALHHRRGLRSRAMYVAVKGGEKAIDNAHALLAHERRGDPAVPESAPTRSASSWRSPSTASWRRARSTIRDLAALAIKQARGDLIEAIFLVRAFRTTLPRFGYSEPLDTDAMHIRRRISATYKDLPGGQVLGPTFDYTHRLIDFGLAGESAPRRSPRRGGRRPRRRAARHRAARRRGPDRAQPARRRRTRRSATSRASRWPFPPTATCACRTWPAATRASCWRSAIRRSAAMAARIPSSARSASARSRWSSFAEELGFAVPLGRIAVTECEMVNQFKGSRRGAAAVHARLRPRLRPVRAQGHVDGAGRPRAAHRANSARTSSRRRRTRNSCCRTPTTSRRPASSST